MTNYQISFSRIKQRPSYCLGAPTRNPDVQLPYPTTFQPLLSDLFSRKVALNTLLRRAASSTVVYTFCACARCNKQVALVLKTPQREDLNVNPYSSLCAGEWVPACTLAALFAKDPRVSRGSSTPGWHACSWAQLKWERNESVHEVIPFTLFTQKICSFEGHVCDRHNTNCWIGADNIQAAPKASNAAEHTEHICSRPRPSLQTLQMSNSWADVFLP